MNKTPNGGIEESAKERRRRRRRREREVESEKQNGRHKKGDVSATNINDLLLPSNAYINAKRVTIAVNAANKCE